MELLICRGCFRQKEVLLPSPVFLNTEEEEGQFMLTEICQSCINNDLKANEKDEEKKREILSLINKIVELNINVPVLVPIYLETLQALIEKNNGGFVHKATNYLIHEHYWVISAFRERYGNGLWVAAAPVNNHLVHLENIKTGADIESAELGDYLNGEGSWLPITFAEDYDTAMVILESKIKKVATNETWRSSVWNAYECIIEENDGHYGLKHAVETKNPALLSQKYEHTE